MRYSLADLKHFDVLTLLFRRAKLCGKNAKRLEGFFNCIRRNSGAGDGPDRPMGGVENATRQSLL